MRSGQASARSRLSLLAFVLGATACLPHTVQSHFHTRPLTTAHHLFLDHGTTTPDKNSHSQSSQHYENTSYPHHCSAAAALIHDSSTPASHTACFQAWPTARSPALISSVVPVTTARNANSVMSLYLHPGNPIRAISSLRAGAFVATVAIFRTMRAF